MRYAEIINELLNSPIPVTWHEDRYARMMIAAFRITDAAYRINFAYDTDNIYAVWFTVSKNGAHPNIKDTGDFQQNVVFSTVIETILHFLKEYRPNELIFSAQGKRNTIYQRMARRIEAKLGKLGYEVGQSGEDFSIVKIGTSSTLPIPAS